MKIATTKREAAAGPRGAGPGRLHDPALRGREEGGRGAGGGSNDNNNNNSSNNNDNNDNNDNNNTNNDSNIGGGSEMNIYTTRLI